jgi:hypothetical protein
MALNVSLLTHSATGTPTLDHNTATSLRASHVRLDGCVLLHQVAFDSKLIRLFVSLFIFPSVMLASYNPRMEYVEIILDYDHGLNYPRTMSCVNCRIIEETFLLFARYMRVRSHIAI